MLVTGVMDIEQSLEARRQALINRRLTQLPVAMPPPQEWRRASVRNMTENSRCLAVAGGRWEKSDPRVERPGLRVLAAGRDRLHGTNNFRNAVPSPARRRLRAVINTDPVTIKDIELRITDPDTAGSPRSGHR
jgi:hypothetical protein